MTPIPEKPRTIALFDVDGTLTIPRGEITPEMKEFMLELSKKITVGIVGGSDLPKQEEQLGEGIAKVFPWNFSQNGLVAYKNGELLEVQTIGKWTQSTTSMLSGRSIFSIPMTHESDTTHLLHNPQPSTSAKTMSSALSTGS